MKQEKTMAAINPKIRLFVEDSLQKDSVIDLSPEQSHYMLNVMRCADGTALALFNGKDGEWLAQLSPLSKKKAQVRVLSQRKPQSFVPDIWYLFAPIKHGRIDFIVQKAAELGASAIFPVITGRTIVSRINEERLLGNAVEAAEQSERLDVPRVGMPQNLQHMLEGWPNDRILLYGDETGEGSPPLELFPTLGQTGKWAVLIGPEGGFLPEELERLRKAEYAHALSLGPRILRSDTAGLAALALVMAFKGDWNKQPRFQEKS